MPRWDFKVSFKLNNALEYEFNFQNRLSQVLIWFTNVKQTNRKPRHLDSGWWKNFVWAPWCQQSPLVSCLPPTRCSPSGVLPTHLTGPTSTGCSSVVWLALALRRSSPCTSAGARNISGKCMVKWVSSKWLLCHFVQQGRNVLLTFPLKIYSLPIVLDLY